MPQGQFRQADIENILTTLIKEGKFACAVVASEDGLPVAMVGEADTPLIAAVAAVMKDLAGRTHQEITQISTRDGRGNQIVNRYFTAEQDLLLLSVKMPVGRAYRRLTNKAIRKIKNVWANR